MLSRALDPWERIQHYICELVMPSGYGRHGEHVFQGNNLLHDGGYVIFENIEGSVEFPHVEYINIVVFACSGDVERFHRVPAQGVGGKVQESLCQGGVCSQIIKHYASVTCTGSQNARLNLVESDLVDGIYRVGPGQSLGGRTLAFEVVDLAIN